jgi:3-hydroxyisobutyrate dehydrogenase
MVRRLLAAGFAVQVWNRSSRGLEKAQAAGAAPLESVAELFAGNATILMSLADEAAADHLLGHDRGRLTVPVEGRTLIQLGTTSPAYSDALGHAVEEAGGRYVEAPVSGSRKPAEEGTLIGMIGARSAADFELAERVLAPLTVQTFRCGMPPAAMTMKLAVNSFLIGMVTSLAESWSFARRLDVDPALFRAILDAGPMASMVSRGKLAKLTAGDMEAQASIADVLMNARLVTGLADMTGVPLSLGRVCENLLARAAEAGFGPEDMIAVEKVADRPG